MFSEPGGASDPLRDECLLVYHTNSSQVQNILNMAEYQTFSSMMRGKAQQLKLLREAAEAKAKRAAETKRRLEEIKAGENLGPLMVAPSRGVSMHDS